MTEIFDPSFILQLVIAIVAAIATGFGIYMAIRVDLIRAMNIAENAMLAAKSAASLAERAHDRVDDIHNRRHG